MSAAAAALIPRQLHLIPQQQIPLDISAWPYIFFTLIPLLCLGYLVRRRDTLTLRLLIFPFALTSLIRVGFHMTIPGEEYAGYNALKSFLSLALLSKAVDYTFYAGGIHRSVYGLLPPKVGNTLAAAENTEISPQSTADDAARDINHTVYPKEISVSSEIDRRAPGTKPTITSLFLTPVAEALEILCAARGLQFEYGRTVPIPPDSRPLEKRAFLISTLKRAALRFLLADAIDTMWKHASPFSTPKGGPIFIQTLPWPTRYLMSTVYHLSTGLMIIRMLELAYDVATLGAVGLLSQSPKAWPPIFWSPFQSQCLQEFWSIRWQQVLRRTFFVYGGIPLSYITKALGLGRGIGLVFGTFIASGIYHELPLYAHDGRWDWRMLQFFVAQAVFVVMERIWEKITGRPVRGFLGKVWVAFAVAGVGQSTFSETLCLRGIWGSMVIPPIFSPIRMIILPILSYIAENSGILAWFTET